MLGGVFFSGPVRGSGAPIGGLHKNPLPLAEPVPEKAAGEPSRRDCGGSHSSASGASSGEGGERTRDYFLYCTAYRRICIGHHVILRHADGPGRAAGWPSSRPSPRAKARCVTRTAGGHRVADSQVLVTADGFREAEHAIGAVATDLEPLVTDGGMYCLVLSNLNTELRCAVVIKPWTELIHGHDCSGISISRTVTP